MRTCANPKLELAAAREQPHARKILQLNIDPAAATAATLAYPAMAALAPAWSALADRALTPNVLARPEMALPALQHLGLPGVLALSRDAGGGLSGALVTIPWTVLPGAPALLSGDFEGFGPIGTPLLDPAAPREAARNLLDGLAAGTGASLLVLRGVAEASPAAAALRQAIDHSGRRLAAIDRHERAALVTGMPGDAHLAASLSSKKRKELRRQLSRLADELGPVAFRMHSGAADVAAGMEAFLSIEDSGWKHRRGTSLRRTPRHFAFFTDAVAALAAEGCAEVAVLTAGDRPVAAGIIVSSGRCAWYFKTAYDESLARYSPGVQLTVAITRALADDPRFDLVDSTAVAGHPMIDHIWRERLAIADWLIELKPGDPRFRIALAAETSRRRLRATARSLVHTLRQKFREIRS
jgi:CelD/BcsL family acetyltransferase involved in cellulose biosynthesis